MSDLLWRPTPEQIEASNINAFCRVAEKACAVELSDYEALYQWSIDQPEEFWKTFWDYAGVIAETRGDTVLVDGDKMPGARWFPDAKLNFAENLLRKGGSSPALIFRGEDKSKSSRTWAELYDDVSQLAQALRSAGLVAGDRVAAYIPNMPEAIIGMLATASIGAVWSSCSPDFGVQGVLDRFGQIEPKVLIGCDGYFYNGNTHDSLEKLAEIVAAIPSLEKVLIVAYVNEAPDVIQVPKAELLEDFVAHYPPADIEFAQLPFDHPLYIMFSSGTTGVPKCIVHGVGGTLLQHLKEHQLHADVKPGDRVFFFSTCGWMMWNWLASALASEATLMLYDGSPFYPNGNVLFDYAQEERFALFGASAKFIDAVAKSGLAPRNTHDLSNLKSILSTGSPLSPEGFEFVYENINPDIQLASVSGGTDILACFALGNPVLPVYRGELQSRALGMRVEVWDDEGNPIREEKGELICSAPFPSMPIGFWNDDDGKKYHAAYFEQFPNVWCHGDYVELTKHDGLIIYGRSDAVLNPGGVRIGTAEIYRQVEKLPEVIESIVIGQEWNYDTRVVLFVRLADGLELNEELIDKIRSQIRSNTTPRHVPAKVLQVEDIPRTKSGKIVELAVRHVVHGREVKNKEALANPEALELFADRSELAVS